MAKLNFDKIIPLLESNQEFSITETQYLENVGKSLPKNPYYLKYNSALAQVAKEYGYCIEIIERTVSLKKIEKAG